MKLSVLDQSVATSDHSHERLCRTPWNWQVFVKSWDTIVSGSVSIIITPRYWAPHLRS